MLFRLIDTTLRDGAQRPGMSWSFRQRVWVATLIASFPWISEIEAGIPAASFEEAALVAEVAGMGLRTPVIAWNRMKESDVRVSMTTGAQRIHITVPASSLHLHSKLGIRAQEAGIHLTRLCALAVDAGFPVSVGLEDASRAEWENLVIFVEAGLRGGADRFRLADTVGIWRPGQVRRVVTDVLNAFGNVDLAVHTHNDLGMACSNALGARDAGAGWADVTVKGVGERAGNCPLGVMVEILSGNALSWSEKEQLLRLERDLALFNPGVV